MFQIPELEFCIFETLSLCFFKLNNVAEEALFHLQVGLEKPSLSEIKSKLQCFQFQASSFDKEAEKIFLRRNWYFQSLSTNAGATSRTANSLFLFTISFLDMHVSFVCFSFSLLLFSFFSLQVRGVNFEAVLRVEEDEANSKRNASKREVEDDLGLSMLIDSQNNQYILTKPRDSTIPRADHHFIKVIILETLLPFVFIRLTPPSLHAGTA